MVGVPGPDGVFCAGPAMPARVSGEASGLGDGYSMWSREGNRAMPPTHAHFNGSVNLTDGESVMREIAARVPSGLRCVLDGEIGDCGNWIFFQMQKFLQ